MIIPANILLLADKFAHQRCQNRSPQYECTYQVWWKSIDIYTSYHLVGRPLCQKLIKFAYLQYQTTILLLADKFAHYWCHIRTPQYQCTYQVWLKAIDIYSSYCPLQIQKYRHVAGRWLCQKLIKLARLAFPNQTSTIAMHIPSLEKIHWHLLIIPKEQEFWWT